MPTVAIHMFLVSCSKIVHAWRCARARKCRFLFTFLHVTMHHFLSRVVASRVSLYTFRKLRNILFSCFSFTDHLLQSLHLILSFMQFFCFVLQYNSSFWKLSSHRTLLSMISSPLSPLPSPPPSHLPILPSIMSIGSPAYPCFLIQHIQLRHWFYGHLFISQQNCVLACCDIILIISMLSGKRTTSIFFSNYNIYLIFH